MKDYLKIKVEECTYLADYVQKALKLYRCHTIGACVKLLNLKKEYPYLFPKRFNVYPDKYFRGRLNTYGYPCISKDEQHPRMLELFKSGKTYRHVPGSQVFYETVNGESEEKDYYVKGYRIIQWIKNAIQEYERFENAADQGTVDKPYTSLNQLEKHMVSIGWSMKGYDLCNSVKKINPCETIVYFKLVPGTARTSQDYPYHKITFLNSSTED